MELDLDKILFYDIEVFCEDALIVFKDKDKETIRIFHNDFEGIANVIKDKTLVGYNNYFYDDFILTAMLKNWSPIQIKKLNDDIISGKKNVIRLDPNIKSLDCFQQIDVAKPGLKKIEGNKGHSIIESEIDFTINRKLTDEEIQETIFYCSNDVDETVDIFKERLDSYFKPKRMVIAKMPEKNRERAVRWNTTSIAGNLLYGDKPLPKWSNIRLDKNHIKADGDYEMLDIVPLDAKNLWLSGKDKGKYTHKEFGCKIEFGFGGLHGVPVSPQKRYENVKLLDVRSLYPNIILKLEALGVHTKQYKEIVDQRAEIKHKDKTLSDALKLVINSTYGLLNNKYSLLYNPQATKSVCFYGQIILYDLCKRLASSCRLININTDGVAFTTDSDLYKLAWSEWEKDWGFVLEEDSFDLFIQKDVNNYIGVNGDHIKVKGGDVGRYHKDSNFRNNNMRIIDIAIVDKIIYDKDILETIMDNLDNPKLFQIILQAGGTYKGTFDKEDRQYQKINRVFPIKSGGVTLYKKRMDDGLVRFPDTPDNMLVWNDDVSTLSNFRTTIDINFYYSLIMKTLERWE